MLQSIKKNKGKTEIIRRSLKRHLVHVYFFPNIVFYNVFALHCLLRCFRFATKYMDLNGFNSVRFKSKNKFI